MKSQLRPLARQTAAVVYASHCLPQCSVVQSAEDCLLESRASQY